MSQVDAIVIGGGVAGLVAAAFLARDGREVVVVEQSSALGGCIGGFTRQGFYFDGGAQSFESIGLVFPLLERLGVRDSLDAIRTDYRLRTPTIDCSLSGGYETVEEAFCHAHPKSARSLRRFFRKLFKVSRAFEKFAQSGRTPFLYDGADRVRALARLGLSHPAGVKALWESHRVHGRDVVERLVDDPGLAAFLGTFGYRGASLFMLGSFFACWRQDYWRPRQGMQQLADVLAESCRADGAKFRIRTSVQEILRSDGRVAGVRFADGDELRAPVVVAACDHTHLLRDLLGQPGASPKPEDVSDAFFSLFLGLDLDHAALDRLLPEHHTFLIPAHRDFRLDPSDRHGHRLRWIEISRNSAPDLDQAPAGGSSITVQTMTRVDWADWWGRGPEGAPTERYGTLKRQVEQELLDSVEQFVPGLREHIRLQFSATPWTYHRYTRNLHGASAGWTWDPARSAVRETLGAEIVRASRGTQIDGLYRCGHWTASPGSVPGSALSGWEAYRSVLRDGL
ncbi:MAG: NAD(P)/FAD-dependent oxidoreductase [Deltaproteobacteria bacterium]|nr:NAD(P)/FAD-dependent oxidoreductase [Deltaproteobacteria bacterium]MBW2532800.1 NAD(P)/FAD-dependent oxidoreductase [Deltaproteobacteria bacterium]